MARLLSSNLSDPIGSAVKSFATFSSALDSISDNKQKRQLTDLQIQAETMKMNNQKQMMDQLDNLQGQLGDMPAYDMQKIVPYTEAIRESEEASKQGKDWEPSEEHKEAIITASVHSPFVTDDPNKITEQSEAANYLNNFMQSNAGKLPQGRHILSEDDTPDLIKNINIFYGKQIDKGSDKTGLTTEKDGVKKKVTSVLFNNDDPSNPKISFILGVTTPVKDGQVFKHIGDDKPKFTVNDEITSKDGNEIGNIDLSNRPVRRNADGSISTVLSMSFEEDGKEVLVPKISNTGKLLSDEEAIKEYRKSGKYLGKFNNEQDADQYAQALHSDPMWNEDTKKYSAKGQKEITYNAPLSLGRDANPNAPVAQVPGALMHAQVSQASKTLAALQKIMILSDPYKFAADYTNRIQKSIVDKEIVGVLKSIPKGLSPQDRTDWLQARKPEGIDWKDWSAIIEPKGTITPLEAMKLNQGERKLAQGERKLDIGKETEEDKVKKADEDRKEKARESDRRDEEVRLRRSEVAGNKKDREDTKKEKDIKSELDKVESIRKDMSKSGGTIKKSNSEDINNKIEKITDLIKKGKSASEARTIVEKEDDKIKSDIQSALNILNKDKKNPPKEGMTGVGDDGTKFETYKNADGKWQWRAKN
jgi:hypothetical protein